MKKLVIAAGLLMFIGAATVSTYAAYNAEVAICDDKKDDKKKKDCKKSCDKSAEAKACCKKDASTTAADGEKKACCAKKEGEATKSCHGSSTGEKKAE